MSLGLPTEEQLKQFHIDRILNDAGVVIADAIKDPKCDFDAWNVLKEIVEDELDSRRDGVEND